MIKKSSKRKVAKRKVQKKASQSPGGFNLSATMLRKLPESEKSNASEVLWEKSKGVCALCGKPLGSKMDLIVADHRVPESKGGKSILSNLYLSHKSCNSSRGNLDFNIAQPLVEFKVFSEDKTGVTFDDVLDKYVHDSNKEIKYTIDDGYIKIECDSESIKSPIFTDMATNTDYFFINCPPAFIHNDVDVQPRLITYQHVRKLALDFLERPVHEPSNCRLVPTGAETAKLLQFDGQHKTTAQILIHRKEVQLKVYVEPDISMLQGLVVKIQQEIKKQPLTRSDTLAKLGDVISSLLKQYVAKEGEVRTEKRFVESQDRTKRTEVKRLYLSELSRIVFFDEDNELAEQVKPGLKNAPTTDKVVIDKIIKPLIYGGLLENVDMDREGGRDIERKLIVLICNTISRKMLPKNWYMNTNLTQKGRTTNFFYQGAIGWWLQEILVPTLQYILQRLGDKKPLFVDPVDSEQEGNIIEAVETLCDWDVWSTDDEDILKAFRSNTIKNVSQALPDYTYNKLIKEVIN